MGILGEFGVVVSFNSFVGEWANVLLKKLDEMIDLFLIKSGLYQLRLGVWYPLVMHGLAEKTHWLCRVKVSKMDVVLCHVRIVVRVVVSNGYARLEECLLK